MRSNNVIIALLVLLCVSCSSRKEPCPLSPIMPIHCSSDTTTIYLTDYVPAVADSDQVEISVRGKYEVSVVRAGILQIVGDTGLGTLQVRLTNQTEVDIPILPHLPTRQALITLSHTDTTIRIGFVEDSIRRRDITLDVYCQNEFIAHAVRQDGDEYVLRLPKVDEGRTYIRLFAADSSTLYNDLLIPLENGIPVSEVSQLNRHDDQAQVLYSLMVDRFMNGDTTNDWKLHSPEVLDIADYQGGDLRGITEKIHDGFFDSLGINTLWISPITQNPWDAWGRYPFEHGNKYDSTLTYTRFTGYHGYWPIYTTLIDKRLGTDKDLRTLLETAHAHDMNIILDYVANHLHIHSPVLQEHPDWHTDSLLPDGRRNFELYDEARLTTWFDVHIPTLDLEREEVYEPMTDSALYWLTQYDIDGFRHDACKHIPECYWRTLGHKIAKHFPHRHIWMIGETYGSPQLINQYVKTGMLNAQFDFNVYFTAIHALMKDGTMSNLNRVILESLATYGSHHSMGNISGNHDQGRFASIAGGALLFSEYAKEAGWTREVGIGNKEEAYKKTLLLHLINMTIPGVPCIYQGDEYGEVGGNDPDNRHMMRFDNRLNNDEKHVKKQVERMIAIRRNSLPLLYGEYIPVKADDHSMQFLRTYMGDTYTVTIDIDGESSIRRGEDTLLVIP